MMHDSGERASSAFEHALTRPINCLALLTSRLYS